MPERGKDPSVSLKDNPVMPNEMPTRRAFNTGVHPERPQALVDRLDKIEAQDITAPGPKAGHRRPYALQGEDEGPLGENGQLRSPDENAGDT